jgi:hypothetical protein
MLEVADDGGAAWSIKAVTFLDYVPIFVGARALHLKEEGSQGIESIGLLPLFSNDIVKFHECVSVAVFFLQSCGCEVLGLEGSPVRAAGFSGGRGPTELIDDFSMDDSDSELRDDGTEDGGSEQDDDEQAWAHRLQTLIADVFEEPHGRGPPCATRARPKPAALREQAAQALARLSETSNPAGHVTLVRALLEREDRLVQRLAPQDTAADDDTPALTEAYPLAAALKFAALCPEAAETLATSGLLARLKTTLGSGLLALEIESIVHAIAEAARYTTSSKAPNCLLTASTAASTGCSTREAVEGEH